MGVKKDIRKSLTSLMEGNLDKMRDKLNEALTKKAMQQLDERKIEIAKNYFGTKE